MYLEEAVTSHCCEGVSLQSPDGCSPRDSINITEGRIYCVLVKWNERG